MHRSHRNAPASCLLLLSVLLPAAMASSVQAGERSLDGVNFTGPLITPNPAGLPQGHWYVEPYLVRSDSRHHFDAGGDRRDSAARSGGWAVVLPVIYGFSDRVTGQVNLSAVRAEAGAAHSSGFRAGDTTARLQYLLQAPDADGSRPAVSVALVQRFTTGSHDRISGNPLDAQGDGVQRTTAALGIQQVVWLRNGRPLRWRGQFSAGPAPARTAISGASVYGTGEGFQGQIARGSVLGVSVGAEYSVNARWVGVLEVAASRESRQHLSGIAPGSDGRWRHIEEHRPASRSISIAPAVEYHFSPALGVIAGVEITVAGRNAGQVVSPQVALGMFF
ncbi:hypothetical protein [Stenotrophomonas sp. 24(2023)]|uniref:hypothetical protein n=1 Tax=Stenotrophomonas sp. 24(2023) TaxID=3068324 RepID=UPI0027DFD228|nr:hypothetical protein [Stenotrophomonas sp. 24(2023)]WMJ70310.1 hypothetical protein Q9R17_04170 [Stenotrophomonas sp. 24(2023)]